MNCPRLVPFAFEHLDRLDAGSFDIGELTPENLNYLRTDWPGCAVSAEIDGRILGIAGASDDRRKAVAWMILSDELRRKFPLFMHRNIRSFLREVENKTGIEKIEIKVNDRFATSRKWAERLGFVKVAEGNTHSRYERKCRKSS